MSDWHADFVEANGLRLHYTRTGGDGPPMVLAHGVTDDGLCWTRLAEALAPEYDIVMADARGHGRSDAPDEGYDPGQQADDLAGVIAALGLVKPAVLGHSMGAATALVLAGTYPDMPGAILLEDPPAWWTGWSETPEAIERHIGMRDRFAALKRKTREELLAEQRTEQPGWADDELQPWVDAKQRFSPRVAEVISQENPRRINWSECLPRITCPALLIIADPELGGIVDTESATALQALAPQLKIAHVAEAGHSIRRDQFERYLDVVRTFLATYGRKGSRRLMRTQQT